MLTLFVALISLHSFAGYENLDQFSSNSRRDVVLKQSQQATGLVKIGRCTGFLLKSRDQNKTFISTSRHCFKYNADQWCQGETSFATIHATGQKIKCIGIAAGDLTHDTIAFEFENIDRDRSGDFSYATAMPSNKTRIEMIGFPKDGFLADRTTDTLVATQNCRIVANSGINIFTDIPEIIDDKVFRHNCSTYGGNSGGPMMIEGTRIVIGIPDQFRAGTTPTVGLENGKEIQGVRVDAFVSDLKKELDSSGISLVNPSVQNLKSLAYFADGSFKDSSDKKLKVFETNYFSNTMLKDLSISGLEEGRFNGHYTCVKQNICKKQGETLTLTITDADHFSIKEKNSARTLHNYSRLSVE